MWWNPLSSSFYCLWREEEEGSEEPLWRHFCCSYTSKFDSIWIGFVSLHSPRKWWGRIAGIWQGALSFHFLGGALSRSSSLRLFTTYTADGCLLILLPYCNNFFCVSPLLCKIFLLVKIKILLCCKELEIFFVSLFGNVLMFGNVLLFFCPVWSCYSKVLKFTFNKGFALRVFVLLSFLGTGFTPNLEVRGDFGWIWVSILVWYSFEVLMNLDWARCLKDSPDSCLKEMQSFLIN